VSTLGHTLKPQALHRLEVITGTGRRRRFSDDDKARIIEETLVPGAPSWVSPQQLFGWRRQSTAACIGEFAGSFFVCRHFLLVCSVELGCSFIMKSAAARMTFNSDRLMLLIKSHS
jgi:hypothetical protein